MARVPDLTTAPIVASAAGTTAVVAAATGLHIVVYAYVIVPSAAVSVKWQSAANDLTGLMALAANGIESATAGTADYFLLRTNAGEALNLNLATAVAVGGHVTYALSAT